MEEQGTMFILPEEEAEMAMLVDAVYPAGDEPPVFPSTSQQHSYAPIEYTSVPMSDDLREEVAAKRMNELTQKYLTGRLPFSEYLKILESNEGDVEGEDNSSSAEEDQDEEYLPASQRPRKSAGKTSKRDAFCREFDASRRKRTGRKELPPILSNLLGQANLKYAQGEVDLAAQICDEIIRQVPQAAGPYKLLALIHKDKGEYESGLYYSLIAAHLSPGCSADEWVALAETSLDFDKKDQALTCLASAIRSERFNPDPRLRQIKLLTKMNQLKAVLRARENMVRVIGSNPKCAQQHGRLILLQAKIAAREYHQENNLPKATSIMEAAIHACKGSASEDDIHLLVELHCEQNENLKGLDLLRKACGLILQPDTPPFTTCKCPKTMEPDLRAKLVVFLVRMDVSAKLLAPLIQMFIDDPGEDHGERFLDVVEALMAKGRYEEAMMMMNPLVESEAYGSAAAVWLTHGECLRHLKNLDGAKKSYGQVISLAPQHIQARLTLSSIHCQLRETEQAIEVLHSDEPEARLLYEEFLLLLRNRPEKSIPVAIALLSQYLKPGRLKEIYELALLKKKREGFDREVENGPSSQELLEVVMTASSLCISTAKYREFKRLVFIALHIKPLQTHSKLLQFLLVVSCIHNRDPNLAWNFCRHLLLQYPLATYVWHLFGLTCGRLEEQRVSRFITRSFCKDPSNWACGMAYSNNCFLSGAYKDALVELSTRHRISPEPYTALMIGVTWTHLVCRKFINDQSSLAVQASSYMEEYKRIREPQYIQEIYYNMGRAMHQLSVLNLAIHYYKLALAAKPVSPDMDLSRECAYNLALIYTTSGNTLLARHIYEKYIVFE